MKSRSDLLRRDIDCRSVIQEKQDRPQQQRAGSRTDEDRNLLKSRRCADQEAGLQILGGCATVRGRDTNDSAHGQRGDVITTTGPADDQEDKTGEQQGGDRHAGHRAGRRTNFARQPRRDRHKQEPENDDQHRAEQIHFQGRREEYRQNEGDDAGGDQFHREVAFGAEHRSVRGGGGLEVRQARTNAVQNNRERANEADDTAGRDRTGADIENVSAADLARAHVSDRLAARRQGRLQAFAKEFDQRAQHERIEDAARHHNGSDTRADNVADAE